jgi:dihydrolipoamide dehydrogenase
MKADLAIIGGGPGGYTAALRAAQLGMSVVLVEDTMLGGVCLNRGCIPTKAMLQTASLAHHLKNAGKFGLVLEGGVQVDYPAALARRDAVVKRLRNGTRGLLVNAKVAMMAGRASFTGPNTLTVEPVEDDVGTGKGTELSGPQTVEAAHIIVATGSHPLRPSVPGIDHPRVLDTDGALALRELPASIVVVGAGAVGCEWSQIFARLGSKVTVVEMLPAVLPRADADPSAELTRALKRDGIAVHTNTALAAVRQAGSGLDVELAPTAGTVPPTGGTATAANAAVATLTADYVLIGAGRGPNTEGLNLAAAGVAVDGKGWIPTDEFQRTNVPSVLAIGDVTGVALLAYVATHQGVLAVEKLAGLSPHPLRRDRIPAVSYTDPEAAGVGLTEAEAREKYGDVLAGRFPLAANGRAVAQGDEYGLMKIVAEPRRGQVLGVHMAGPHVGEMLGEAVLALELEATLDELGSMIRPHPTMTEAFGEAALAARGRALNI